MILLKKILPRSLVRWGQNRLLLFVPIFFLIVSSSNVRSDQEWRQHFLSEAPRKWAALEEFYSHIDVEYEKTQKKIAGDFAWNGWKQQNCKVRRNRNMIVWEMRQIDQQDRERIAVRGTNGQYEYRLSKPSADETFHIDRFEPAAENATSSAANMVFGAINAPMAVSSTEPLYHYMQGKLAGVKFVLKDATPIRRGGRNVASVQYELHYPPPVEIERVTAVFDPDNYWCVLEDRWENSKWTGTETIQYGDPSEGYPIPVRFQAVSRAKTVSLSTQTTTVFTHFAHRDVPERDFDLSAFDLPELQVPGQAPRRRNWLWFLLAGLVLSIIAILSRYYVDKKRKQSANPSSLDPSS